MLYRRGTNNAENTALLLRGADHTANTRLLLLPLLLCYLATSCNIRPKRTQLQLLRVGTCLPSRCLAVRHNMLQQGCNMFSHVWWPLITSTRHDHDCSCMSENVLRSMCIYVLAGLKFGYNSLMFIIIMCFCEGDSRILEISWISSISVARGYWLNDRSFIASRDRSFILRHQYQTVT
jgi:hypothetical protein